MSFSYQRLILPVLVVLLGFSQNSNAATALSNSTVSAAGSCAGSTKVVVQAFSLAQTSSAANFTSVVFSTAATSTYVAADVTKFQLWTNTTNSIATATQVGANLTTSLGVGSHTISGFTQALTVGATRYFWITTDVSALLSVSHTLVTSNISSTAITVSTGTVSGSANAGGLQTFYPALSSNTATADQAICSGATPVALTGSTPTGGNGTYTYLWESSTTSASAGFATATGTSNAKNYTPVALTTTTWYRRTVSSGGCSTVSSAVQITVNPLPGAVAVSGGGVVCSSTTLVATGGAGGTIYFQGTTSGGISTSNSNTSQNISASGTYYFIAQTSAGCWGTQVGTTVTVQTPPTITDASVCQGGSGSLIATAICPVLSGQTAGANNAGSAAENSATGVSTWTNPGNITTVGTPYATTVIATSSTSRYLQGSSYGFAIPSTATINGITVVVNRQSSSATNLRDNIVSLVKGGTIQATNRAVTGTNWGTTMATATYGSTSDLWGSTWTPADINASNFGVVFSASNLSTGGTRTATIDYIQVTVTYSDNGQIKWYTASSGGSTIGSGSPFNPVGVSGSGLANTNTAGTTTFYAECSTTPGCRAAADFVVISGPSITNQPTTPAATCSGSGIQTISVTATGTGSTYSWRKAGVTLGNGGAISGQGTSTLTLTNPTLADAGSYDVVIGTSSCVSTVTSDAVTVTINTSPLITTQPVDPAATCPGSGVQTINVIATGTGLSYSWRIGGVAVANNAVVSGQGTATLTLTNPALTDAGSYDVVITGTCASSVTSDAVTVTVSDTQNPLISNCPSNISLNTSGSCSASAIWVSPFASDNCSVASFTSSHSSGDLFSVGTTTVTYTATDVAGNSTTSSFDVTVVDNEYPVITSCPSDINVIADGSGTAAVTWTAPSVGDNCTVINFASDYLSGDLFPVGTTTVTYTATDASGNLSTCSFDVVVVNPSIEPSGINSTAGSDMCTGSVSILSPVGGMLSQGAQWVWYTGGCGGTQIGTGSLLTVTPTATTTYFVRAEDGAFATACASITITVNDSAPAPDVFFVSGVANACSGTTGVFAINSVPGATTYVWSATNGTLINGLSGNVTVTDTFVTVSFGPLPGTGISGYNICVYASNSCGNSLSKCMWVRGSLGTPVFSVAPVVVCTGVATTYSVAPMSGAATYTWSATGGAVITGNGNSTVTITFPVGYISGTISVSAQMACGNTSPSRSIALNSAPSLPGAIIGQAIVCPGATLNFYIAAVPGASSYTWTVPTGCTFTGSGTVISVTFPATFVSGSICVTAVSSCGSNSALRCKSVSTGKLPTPGNITGDPTAGVCGQMYQYSIPSLANATLGYTWTIPAGVTVIGSSTSNSITLLFPSNFISGTIAVHGNNDCGPGYDRSIPVYGNPSTPGLITGSTSVCRGSVEMYSWVPIPGATQYQVFAPAGALILGGGVTSSTYVLIQWGTTSGNISLKAVNGCGVSGTRVLAVAITCRTTDLNTKEEVADITAYPNPNHGLFNVNIDSKIQRTYVISVFDQTGRLMKSVELNAEIGMNLQEFNLEGVATGMYILRVESATMETLNKTIIVQ
ncbi:MAG: HYR domain-containing protein [Bacteroidetes bacterium]|nr:HYR domain-containing protein [Bacteroidota bacterium]